MQNVFIHIGEALLVFATLGIVVVLALERILINRRSKPKTKSQSFLEVIKPKPSRSFLDVINRPQPNGEAPQSHNFSEPHSVQATHPMRRSHRVGWPLGWC